LRLLYVQGLGRGITGMSIFGLVNEIDSGEVVLPAIQRDFVWDEDRIELLFDSIFRGYPVGIVLLWETYHQIQYRPFSRNHVPGSVHQFEENNKGKRIKLVLDGQQRLSSAYVALRGTFNGRKLFYDVLSGLESDDHSEVKYRFKFADDAEARELNKAQAARRPRPETEPLTHWVKLSEIIGSSPSDIQKLRNGLSQKLSLTEADKLRMELNIQTAVYALTGNSEILKTQTIDSNLPADDSKRKSAFDILEIFVRINSQGVPLKRSDLIVSMLRLYWPEASTLLPHFIDEINESGNLNIDNDFVIRCMFSTGGIGTRLDIDLLRKKSNVEKIKNSYNDCFDAIRSAVDFVRNDCAIDSPRLLGGINTLVPVVHYLFYSKSHTFSKSARSEARRILFLFAFAKTFTQHSDSRTGAFIRECMPDIKEIINGSPLSFKSAALYVYHRSNFDLTGDRLFGHNIDLALSILQRKSGGKTKLSANLPEIDHIFPRSELASRDVEPQEIDDIGNLWILPRDMNRNKSAMHPKDYLANVDDDTLRLALIDRELLDYRSYRKFIRNRRSAIVAELREITGLSEAGFRFLEENSDESSY
jgi:hypothetical protein